jgi:transposase InsO family protein
VAHPSARLTVFSRQLLVKRVVIDGWPTATVAEQLGISRATAYKWVRRYRADGLPGLEDRSSRPHRSPRRSSDEVTATILRARARRRYGPARLAPLTGHPRSTIYGVLRRAGLNRLRDTDRVTAAPVRYVACHPGALVHQDHKKLGRVPAGGGWRALGRESLPRPDNGRVGYDHLEVFVDDASRYAVVVPVADERGESASWAVELAVARFAEVGIRIERMLTDNGASYRSHAFRDVLERFEIRHKRTRPFRPQTNGKAERFIQTLLNEWAYARPYRSNGDRLHALRRFVDFYNYGRPHTAIGGLVPRTAVNNVPEHHTSALWHERGSPSVGRPVSRSSIAPGYAPADPAEDAASHRTGPRVRRVNSGRRGVRDRMVGDRPSDSFTAAGRPRPEGNTWPAAVS